MTSDLATRRADGTSGPAADAVWERTTLTLGGSDGTGGQSVPVLTVPDRSDSTVTYVLPAYPSIRHQGSNPVISVTVLLSRDPRPDEPSIRPLVEHVVLTFDASTRPPDPASASVGGVEGSESEDDEDDTDYRPLFAERVQFDLVDTTTDSVLASATAAGSAPSAALSATLDSPDARRAVGALNGEASGLALRADVQYGAVDVRTVRLRAPWRGVHDAVNELAGGITNTEPAIPTEVLREHFVRLCETDVVDVRVRVDSHTDSPSDSSSVEMWEPVDLADVDDVDVLFRAFLEQADPVLGEYGPPWLSEPVGYVLRPVEDDGRLDRTVTLTSRVTRSVVLDRPLEALFETAFDGEDIEAYVSLISMGNGGRTVGSGGIGPTPVRVRGRSETTSRAAGPDRLELTTLGGHVQPAASLLQPKPLDSIRPERGRWEAIEGIRAGRKWQVVSDLAVEGPMETPQHLPVVGDRAAVAWRDRLDPERYWFAPRFRATPPGSEDDAFSFDCEVVDEGSDEPGFRGTVTLSVDVESPEADAPVDDGGRFGDLATETVEMVPFEIASVGLSVPYTKMDGTSGHETFGAATVTREGDRVIATFDVLDQWVRACYGALSRPTREERPQVLVSYTFQAYERADDAATVVSLGTVDATLPLRRLPVEVEKPQRVPLSFDVKSGSLLTPGAELRLRPHEAGFSHLRSPSAVRGDGTGIDVKGATDEGHGQSMTVRTNTLSGLNGLALIPQSSKLLNPIRIEGPLELDPGMRGGIPDPILRPKVPLRRAEFERLRPWPKPDRPEKPEVPQKPEKTFVRRSIALEDAITVAYPCNEFGARYRRTERSGETFEIGCDAAFDPGFVEYRQYEAVTDSEPVRAMFGRWPELGEYVAELYSSLQQPNRFLVVPRRYRITRHSPAKPDVAYRACAAVTIDSTASRETDWYAFQFCLEPDLPVAVRRLLETALAGTGRSENRPQLQYPTDVATLVGHVLQLPAPEFATSEANVTAGDNAVFVDIRTEWRGGPVLIDQLSSHAGIAGRLDFELADGTAFGADLELSLRSLVGPWDGGLVATRSTGINAVAVENRCYVPVDVTQLYLFDDGAGSGRSVSELPIERTLSPGEAMDVAPVRVGPESVYARYLEPTADSEAAVLDQARVFSDELRRNLVFVSNLVDYDDAGLRELLVYARFANGGPIHTVSLTSANPTDDITFTMPLVSDPSDTLIEYKIERVPPKAGEEASETGWTRTDLSSSSIVRLDGAALEGLL